MNTVEQISRAGDGLLVRAPAKLNLSLLVAGKRPDGYHDIETIMAKVDWFDEILIERQKTKDRKQKTGYTRRETEDRRQNIELVCKGEYTVPQGQENIVYKAAKLAFETAGKSADVKITLTKNIPAGSGLGSGSSDAAGTLLGINKFLTLGLSREKLWELSAQLGSDISFFLGGPIGFCTGRGEKVKMLNWYNFEALVIFPDVSVSTKRVYENYRHNEGIYKRLNSQISEFIEKNRIDLVCQLCANMLQESCFELYKELKDCKKRIESLGVGPMCLSGSGSSMFCIINADNEEGVRTYREHLNRESGCRSIIVNNNRW